MKLYNTLSGKIEKFTPQEKGKVSLYSCGVTTYDEIHLGHARQAIIFDVLRNYLEFLGFNVKYVRNFTDIDDKIINRALEQKKDPLALSDFYVKKSIEDLKKLKVRSANFEPKVTDHIPEIVELIKELLEKNFAYEVNGEILFNVDNFKEYGKLSHRKLEDLLDLEDSAHKKHFYDFVLWKPAKPGEPFWPSPWGPGRPGWHIECSSLARKYLGKTIDIHGGGIDLVFPHHENEIAQSEAANDQPLAQIWVHNGLVMVNGQKMSKSLDNFYIVEDLLKQYTADEIRFTILSHHYSSPIDFSDQLFATGRKRIYYFYKTLDKINSYSGDQYKGEILPEVNSMLNNASGALADNFNTARAVAIISKAFTAVNNLLASNEVANKSENLNEFKSQLKTLSQVLGILDEQPNQYLKALRNKILQEKNLTISEIEKIVEKRTQAKKSKDWTLADQIRSDLEGKGILVQDRGDQVFWEINLN